jgi:raffinose/stachyose/melibiose transport system substrate-binding protein
MKYKALFLFLLLMLSFSAVVAQDTVSLTYLVDDSQNSQESALALAEAFMAENPNVSITIESRPGGADGDNIVKTRLATGEMTDIFWYNTGSLLQALNPSQTLLDLSDQPFMENIVESFLPTVSQGEGVFGVPTGTAMGGGILYNKAIYAELGLSVPLTWEEFAANNAVIAEAGIAPVIATFGDTWTSQLNTRQALRR